ncbi:hypothetical protein C0Q70_04732 [Pomacea canaliculata]|uniref:C-type lectin domain-containing protein n=1 Tax=Pomacea canaliculata TaxID=400727 RepID=A0A2T7PJ67_POMCA|nr:hypothetical protein C0Q70_04732 [Pomacea canaliculata]
MVARKVVVFRCGMLVFAIECLSCFSATSSAGTTAAQWTLYSGLKLSWNEASMFCKSLGGHLPVINTKLKWNAFNATVVNWQKANLSPSPVPNSWEADCSLQPDGLNFWGPSEPDNLHTELLCEVQTGSCRSTTGSLLQTLLHTTLSKGHTEASCWNECLNYPPTGSGQECVGVTFSLLGLLVEPVQPTWQTFAIPSSSSLSSTLLDTTMVKECFRTNITDFCSNYTFVDNSNTPLPAGDPCSSNTTSFVPDVLVSINSTCIHTSAASSSQTSTSGKNLAQTTKQQSGNVSQTGTTWPTTTTTSMPRNFDIGSTMPVNSSTYSIITSTVEVTNSTRVNNSTHSITSSTKPVATGSTSSTWGTVQSNDGLTTNRDISTQVFSRCCARAWYSYPTPPLGWRIPSSIATSHPSTEEATTPSGDLPAPTPPPPAPPSSLSSSSAGLLFVASDINRCTCLFRKKRRGTVERLLHPAPSPTTDSGMSQTTCKPPDTPGLGQWRT